MTTVNIEDLILKDSYSLAESSSERNHVAQVVNFMLAAPDEIIFRAESEMQELFIYVEIDRMHGDIDASAELPQDPELGLGSKPPEVVERRVAARRRFQRELHKLLCGGKEYEEERKKFSEQFTVGQTGFAAAVTTILVPVLGQSAPALGACVALSFAAISKVGLRAWCEKMTAEFNLRESRDDVKPTDGDEPSA